MDIERRMRKEAELMQRPLHGGDGWRIRNVEDFSANLNPYGPPADIAQLLSEAAKSLDHYPDDSSVVLKEAVAEHHGLRAENIIPGTGSSELIRLFPEVFMERGDKVLMPRPTFGEYAFGCNFMGAEIVWSELPRAKGFRCDVGKLVEILDESFKAVYLCNPNNPTGTTCTRAAITELLREAERRNVLVFLDETLLELLPNEPELSCASLVESHDNLFIIRSLTKSFAIPGLRVGYGLGSKRMISCLERGRQTWNLGQLEQSVAALLIKERQEYVTRAADVLALERDRVFAHLSRLGVPALNRPDAFFFFQDVSTLGHDSRSFREAMRAAGALVRDCASFGSPFDRYVRFCVKTPEKDALLLHAWETVLESGQEG